MKPSIPKGTRDFGPFESARREYIFDTIKSTFKKYGYAPLETPSFENSSTLMGKYGDEGDQLIFKILNSGDYLANVNNDILQNKDSKKALSQISEKALRYDLTVPFARYVSMNHGQLVFPFKRYQIQAVWRADRPQKGRYREFVQCDADSIGSTSLLNEVELVDMTQEVFSNLGIEVLIKINNRKILSGIAEIINEPEKIISITVTLDKLDKIGEEAVITEMLNKGVSADAIEKLKPVLQFKGDTAAKISFLRNYLSKSEIGLKGVEELEFIFSNCNASNLEVDITLARGLNYYTGAIFEVKVNDPKSTFTGSISGGGRYDDLTGMFGLKNMSGVGISYGADRIYDVLEELKLFPSEETSSVKVLVVNFGGAEEKHALNLLRTLRHNNISAELYPEASKMKKQLDYADRKKIPFALLAGSEEIASGNYSLKDLRSGEQKKLNINEIIQSINI